MIVSRVEKHIVKSNSTYFKMLDSFCFASKNLYNHANYVARKEFKSCGSYIGYVALDKILKADTVYPDYKQMPTAQSAQQTLRLLDQNWKSFFATIKDYKKNPDKYLGRPRPPKCLSKTGRYVLTLTNQNVRLKNGMLCFPKIFAGFTIRPKFHVKSGFVSFQQVRIIPHIKRFCIELVYNIEIPNNKLPDNRRYMSIDIGVDNLATISNNIGSTPIIINGRGLKSINKYYNKLMSHYRGTAKRMNKSDYTHRMERLTTKRNVKINDYMHKASRFIVNYAVENNFNTIIIGKNKNWKQNSLLSKSVNQSFVGIPHQRLIEMISYKSEEFGLNVILTEESYTSGTSFLDNETPTQEKYNKSRRVLRGLFVSNDGVKINADVNGSLQIMKKVFPNAFADGIEGVVLHPVRVNVA